MVTKEWVAIHRKHHAKCETEDDPHSPQTRGIKTVLLTGSELYRTEAKNQETLAKFGHGTPDDWIERNLYTRYSWQGVGLMLIIDLMLFGAIGADRLGGADALDPDHRRRHHQRHRPLVGLPQFRGARRQSTNVSPWGIIIGGEELHNNHHTYPTSAKLSVKPYEFDIGWVYIRGLEMLGLAKVRKTPPKLKLGAIKPVADDKTLEAMIANRYEVMAKYARSLRRASRAELARLKAEGAAGRPRWPTCAWRAAGCTATTTRSRTASKAQVAGALRVEPVPGQAGGDARRAAPALDAHQRVGRAAGRRPAGLVPARPRRAASPRCRSSRCSLRAAHA